MKALLTWVGLCAALFAHDVWAHAVLVESVPPADARLVRPPERILLRFSEPIVPISLQILSGDRRPIDLPEVEASGTDITVPLPSGLAAGTYLVSYRVRSADTDPVGGSLVFTVGDAPTTFPDVALDRHDPLWRWAGLVVRTLLYACLLVVAGAHLLAWLLRAPAGVAEALVAPLHALSWLGLAAQITLLGVAGAALVGGPPSILLTVQPWQLALGSPLALSAMAAILGLLLLLWGHRRRRAPDGLRACGSLLITLSFALSGHAETASSRWLTIPVIWLHATCVAFWVGEFWPLLVALRRPVGETSALLALFSPYATVAVGLLVAAGSVMMVLQLRALDDITGTIYGQRLGSKLLMVAAMLGLAALNRFYLTPALRTERSWPLRWLRTTLCLDLVLALAVIGLTASLSLDPPPRALAHDRQPAAQPRTDYAVQARADGYTLVAVLVPATTGRNRLTLYPMADHGQPLRPKEVAARLSLPAQGIEPLALAATGRADGNFVVEDIQLPIAGAWDLLIDDFTKVIVKTRLHVVEAGR